MKKIVNKYSCVFFFFIGSFVMLAQVIVPPPPNECCLYLTGEELEKCLEMDEVEPNSYCNMLPIDNSKYIYISMVAAVALASFVIARKMNKQKTPM